MPWPSLNDLKTTWRGDAVGGAVGALIALPTVLSCGIVIFSGVSPALTAAGIAASFATAVLCAVVAGLFGGPTLHVNSPKTSHAAILAGLTGAVAMQPDFAAAFPGGAAAPALMAVCFLTLLVSGGVQFGLGAAGLGAVVKFVPHPVLAGFVNGFALQIILGQVPRLFGVERLGQVWTAVLRLDWHGLLPPGAIALGLGSLVLMQVVPRLTRVVPAPLAAMTLGTLGAFLAGRFVDPAVLGPIIGQLPGSLIPLPRLGDMAGLVGAHGFLPLAFPIVATGVTLAMVSSIQSLLSIAAADGLSGTRHDSNAELMVQGAGNALAAVFGGTPSGGSPNVTQAVHANGGRSNRANLAHAAALAVLGLVLGRAIAVVPVSVMAAVVIASTAAGFDRWSRQLLTRVSRTRGVERSDLIANLVIVVLVTLLVVGAGALVALGVGMSVAFMIFLARAGDDVVRRVLRGDAMRSRTSRSQAMDAALAAHGGRIVVVELQGALFFGTAEAMARAVEAVLDGADWVVLDLRRVSLVDSSGVMALKRIDETLRKRGKRLLLAHLTVGGRRASYMASMGFAAPQREGRCFGDTDMALHEAENALLVALGLDPHVESEVALEGLEVLVGLSAEAIATVSEHLIRHVFPAGAVIVRRDDGGRSLYLLTRGRVSVRIGGGGRGEATRLQCHDAGVAFGEMALLSGLPRSADVVADCDCVVHELPAAAFDRLSADSPEIVMAMLRNLATALSDRLRTNIVTVRLLEG